MNSSSSLENILNKHGSDKARKHHYHTVYENVSGDLLEVGAFKGDSLAAWREFLPESVIVGLDLFERVSLEEVRARVPDDVVLVKGDSTRSVEELEDMKFDTIIDDGCHWPKVQMATLVNLWPLLKEGGSYYIEDVWDIRQLDHPWAVKHREHLNEEAINHLYTGVSFVNHSALYHHELWEETGEPDSCIIQLIK